ncbi:MAG: transketolase, partial [Nitrospina sp.]|nr:transketolase [Nitrospina sp.]
IKGKGGSFMEGNKGWHGVAPNEEDLKKALKELDS